ncbi:DUF349 domain-containing protein [Paracrocinitomix mangrovi]|uniref:DUF349 domain-containing protein n=1 Tax=Paracrocinitomix mangrovi TaxID=2862509 RepID=UPI001C8D7C6E|nr:DUF349 domain-containing protein [Paracrocinitomix mangrovi]UKN00667.1 DUF349 domain-containing protein [Paracrocinitomix mangrovi]
MAETKAEIIEQLDALAHKEKVLDDLEEFNQLVSEFDRLQREEEHAWEVQKLERIEAGEKPENIEKPIFEQLEEFKRLTSLYKDKKKVEVNEIRESEKSNYEKKKALIAALTDLIQNEENIGRAISRFRDIQDSWKEAGTVAREKRQELQREFSNLVESFKYNINIYKDIKDHDLNRNLSLKKDLLDKLKALLDIKIIKEVEEKLHTLQDEWNNIGGTHQEDWEKIKNEYWDTVNAVYQKIHQFYKERREERAENIEKKKEIIQKAQQVLEREISSHKGWKKQTDIVIGLQEEWKSVGYGPKEENNAVWKEFRKICNEFFARKKEFYGGRNDQFEDVKDIKEKLIKEVESIKTSTDWGSTTKQIVQIQKKWKDAGSAGPKYENKLWKEFRAQIDEFFDAKDKHFADTDKAFKDNLDAKEKVIKEIEAYKVVKDDEKNKTALQDFAQRFGQIGSVSKKDRNRVQKAYRDAINAKFEKTDIDQEDQQRMLFESKIEAIKNSDDPESMIDRERAFIRKKIGRLNEDLTKLETNMSFFANADESNPLLKSALGSIENTKQEIEGLKSQLSILRQVENEIFEDEDEETVAEEVNNDPSNEEE